MAKQPRQQPIGFYGKFQPTGVDDSAAQRMQALAGLGETVAGVAEKFGIAKANELAPEEGRKAAEKALAEGTELQKEARCLGAEKRIMMRHLLLIMLVQLAISNLPF